MSFIKVCLNKVSWRRKSNIAALAGFLFLTASCIKEEAFVMEGDPGKAFGLTVSDTTDLILRTDIQPARNGKNLDVDVIGSFRDPIFGQTNTVLYSQFRPLNTNSVPDFTGAVFDNMVLTIKCKLNSGYSTSATIGNITTPQRFLVYQLANCMPDGASDLYPNDTSLSLGPILADQLAGVSLSDSTLRITLNGVLAQQLFAAQGIFDNGISFSNAMKGLAIQADATLKSVNQGSLFPVLLTHPGTTLILYYHNNAGPQTYTMTLGSPCQHVNTYSHDDRETDVSVQLGTPNVQYEKVYLQALKGLQVAITIPSLKDYVKDGKNIAVHKAEFIFPKVNDPSDQYNTGYEPPFAMLFPRGKNGKDFSDGFTDHQAILNYYGGEWSSTKQEYRLTITRHIQDLLFGFANKVQFTDYGLNLSVPNEDPTAPNRVILGTQLNPNAAFRPRMILTYSKPESK